MSEVDRLSNSGLYPALPIADKRPSRRDSGGGAGMSIRGTNPRRKQLMARIQQPHVLPSLLSTSTLRIIMNFNTVFGIVAATLGFLALIAALFAVRGVRSWRARCLSVESSLTAVRRGLKLVASIKQSTLRAAAPIRASWRSSSA